MVRRAFQSLLLLAGLISLGARGVYGGRDERARRELARGFAAARFVRAAGVGRASVCAAGAALARAAINSAGPVLAPQRQRSATAQSGHSGLRALHT